MILLHLDMFKWQILGIEMVSLGKHSMDCFQRIAILYGLNITMWSELFRIDSESKKEKLYQPIDHPTPGQPCT